MFITDLQDFYYVLIILALCYMNYKAFSPW